MRRFILTAVVSVLAAVSAFAADLYSRDVSTLPKAARATLTNNFKAKVSLIKIDKDFGRISDYEVILTDGTEVGFDRNGNWNNVEVRQNGSVPSGFVPKAIQDYVKRNHKGRRIVGIEKEGGGYDVELSDGVEMKFDKAGNFKRYDD